MFWNGHISSFAVFQPGHLLGRASEVRFQENLFQAETNFSKVEELIANVDFFFRLQHC